MLRWHNNIGGSEGQATCLDLLEEGQILLSQKVLFLFGDGLPGSSLPLERLYAIVILGNLWRHQAHELVAVLQYQVNTISFAKLGSD